MLRSAAKPLQALPAVRDGVIERYDLAARHVAVACGSHEGTPAHAAAVAELLARAGLPLAALRPRGVHPPLAARRRACARARRPGAHGAGAQLLRQPRADAAARAHARARPRRLSRSRRAGAGRCDRGGRPGLRLRAGRRRRPLRHARLLRAAAQRRARLPAPGRRRHARALRRGRARRRGRDARGARDGRRARARSTRSRTRCRTSSPSAAPWACSAAPAPRPGAAARSRSRTAPPRRWRSPRCSCSRRLPGRSARPSTPGGSARRATATALRWALGEHTDAIARLAL